MFDLVEFLVGRARLEGTENPMPFHCFVVPQSSYIHTALELNRLTFVRFQVLATLLLKIQVFWDVTLCHGVSSLWCFKESWCLHLQSQASLLPVLPNLETSQRTCCVMRCYIPQTSSYVHFAWTRMCRSNKLPVKYRCSTCGTTKLATNIWYVMFKNTVICAFF